MDYEQKYKEALELARDYYKANSKLNKTDENVILEDIFPELKESEDEKMRKQLLNWFKGCHWDSIDDGALKRNDIIAWLEKQSELKAAWSEEDRTMAFTLMRDVDQMSYISKEGKNERIGWLNSLDEKFASRESTWSEEDEKNSYHLKILLENLTKDNKYEFRIISDNDRDKYTTWLKSLKQRIGG